MKTINAPNIPDALFQAAAEKCLKRMHFLGEFQKTVGMGFVKIMFPQGAMYMPSASTRC